MDIDLSLRIIIIILDIEQEPSLFLYMSVVVPLVHDSVRVTDRGDK